jgi:hypothetical protein
MSVHWKEWRAATVLMMGTLVDLAWGTDSVQTALKTERPSSPENLPRKTQRTSNPRNVRKSLKKPGHALGYSDTKLVNFRRRSGRIFRTPEISCVYSALRCASDRRAGSGVPTGIRTPVLTVKGWCPRPLDDGDNRRKQSITLSNLVEPGGIEPPTSCMPCKRSPS